MAVSSPWHQRARKSWPTVWRSYELTWTLAKTAGKRVLLEWKREASLPPPPIAVSGDGLIVVKLFMWSNESVCFKRTLSRKQMSILRKGFPTIPNCAVMWRLMFYFVILKLELWSLVVCYVSLVQGHDMESSHSNPVTPYGVMNLSQHLIQVIIWCSLLAIWQTHRYP